MDTYNCVEGIRPPVNLASEHNYFIILTDYKIEKLDLKHNLIGIFIYIYIHGQLSNSSHRGSNVECVCADVQFFFSVRS